MSRRCHADVRMEESPGHSAVGMDPQATRAAPVHPAGARGATALPLRAANGWPRRCRPSAHQGGGPPREFGRHTKPQSGAATLASRRRGKKLRSGGEGRKWDGRWRKGDHGATCASQGVVDQRSTRPPHRATIGDNDEPHGARQLQPKSHFQGPQRPRAVQRRTAKCVGAGRWVLHRKCRRVEAQQTDSQRVYVCTKRPLELGRLNPSAIN